MGIRIQMAELKPNERQYLAEGIKRLVEDDINVPFRKSEGVGNDIYRGLESLRQKAVEDACKRTEEQEKVQQAIANVTHDLKTPLALITGYAECVEDGMDDKNYAELIREKALQMNDTVLKIIDAARTDAKEKSKEKKLYKAGNFFSPLIENGLFDAAKEKGIKVQHGVYIGTQGPTFETPAEYKLFHILGADAVGMSTVPEVIVANHCGIKVFGISVITDLGVEGKIVEVTHEEVQKAADAAQPKMTTIMRELINRA